jgi:hypothetical protein
MKYQGVFTPWPELLVKLRAVVGQAGREWGQSPNDVAGPMIWAAQMGWVEQALVIELSIRFSSIFQGSIPEK